MEAQQSSRHVLPFVDADGRGLSVTLLGRALFTGLLGIVAMLLLSVIADPLFRLLGENQGFDLLHRFHDIGVFVQSLLLLVVPLAAQLRYPERRPGAMVLALSGAVFTFLVSLTVGEPDMQTLPFVGFLTVLAILHPARRRLFALGHVAGPVLALALVGVVPLVVYGVVQVGYDRSGVGPLHAAPGHWRSMAGLSFTMAFGALFAAWRPGGWRLVAWVTGLSAVALGATSALWPQQASSFGVAWGVAAIVWGAAYCAVAESTYRRGVRADAGGDAGGGPGDDVGGRPGGDAGGDVEARPLAGSA